MRWKIRSQLLLPILLLLVGGVAVSIWTGLGSVARTEQQIDTQVRNVGRVLSESRFPLTPSVLEQVKGLSGAEFLLIQGDGRQVATLSTGTSQLATPDAIAENWQNLSLGPRAIFDGQTYFCCGVRLGRKGAEMQATLYILYPESLWREALWQAVQPSLWLGGFVSLASLALAVMVARRLGRRILELERRTRQIAAGNFSPMPLSRQNDELNDLSRSVNDMAGRLFHLQDEVKKNERLRLFGQVSAGLAHQLRNGVTGARLAVQLHARECTNPGDGEALSVALRQLNLLELNLKRFLQFGRPDELRSELCSLTQPVEDAIALLRHQCHHAHIDLRWNSPPVPASVRADVAQLGQLFLNLITNAMDAAGPGGWVEVTINVLQSPPNAVVEITDSGPGPAPELAERLFEPFVTGKPDGVGLGLAVARQIAETHGGRITYRRALDRTCFIVELPLERSMPGGP